MCPARTRSEPGKLNPEIEITPAMVSAGTLALSQHDSEFESSDAAVIRIFRMMLEASIDEASVLGADVNEHAKS